MSEMIERVARAMWERDTAMQKGFARSMGPQFVAMWHHWDQCSEIWKELAKTAIEAMREPTEAMIRRGDDVCFEWIGPDATWTRDSTISGYRAMIDEALGEKP